VAQQLPADLPGAEFAAWTASDTVAAFRQGSVSPVEVTRALLERAAATEPHLQVFLTHTPDIALRDAAAAERLYRQDPERAAQLPLLGVPITIKDLVPTQGIRTTMGSRLLSDWVPEFDSPVSERLRAAGTVLFGKSNTSEYGWKGDAGNRLVGPTHNPWDLTRSAGGSSGGAAAAVAAGINPVAHGTDGAGSVRIPAAFCGVVGFKPSYGRIPYYPASAVFLFAHHGAIARTVADAWRLVEAMCGPDERDPLSIPAERSDGVPDVATLRVGFCRGFGELAPEPAVLALVEQAVAVLERDLGIAVDVPDPAALPADPYSSLHTLWAAAHAARIGDDLDNVAAELDPGLLKLVEEGRRLRGIDVASALIARAAYIEEIRAVADGFDALVMPTLPCRAFPVGLDQPASVGGVAAQILAWTPNTYPFNISGYPAVSVPCGVVDGLPVAMQIVGRWREDATPVALAAAYERTIGGFPSAW
jgi:aspartyl-tRNA(Asn)/glutamyl-tRNA(Gln) amidotransferase subunit A